MILQRDKPKKDRQTGIWTLPDGTGVITLERPWLDNIPNISCIPAGIYKFRRDKHGRHKWFRLEHVEGRTDIEIHEGKSPADSLGCILMSKGALLMLQDFCYDESVQYILEIRDYVKPA